MCGLGGFYVWDEALQYQQDAALQRLTQGTKALRHRGPDGEGRYIDASVGLFHTRLSIIDPKGAIQPMRKTIRGRTGVLVYNGELYNTSELKRSLYNQEPELRYETHSDTEVLLAGLLLEGAQFLSLVNGIFAFAFWDGRELLLARDRLGVKPLCFAREKTQLLFGSEPKALFAMGVQARLQDDGLRELFALAPAHTPGTTVFAGVEELLPGESLTCSPSGVTRAQYWSLVCEDPGCSRTFEETAEQVRWLLEDSVRRQMVSDVPICAFLSGGLDSSLLTSICQTHLHQTNHFSQENFSKNNLSQEIYQKKFNFSQDFYQKNLVTFSFDFTENSSYSEQNAFQIARDEPYAQAAAAHLGTEHHTLVCSPEELLETLEPAMVARDAPGMADIDGSLLFFCQKVAREFGIKVALTGECADESNTT